MKVFVLLLYVVGLSVFVLVEYCFRHSRCMGNVVKNVFSAVGALLFMSLSMNFHIFVSGIRFWIYNHYLRDCIPNI